jgi:tetratricopeptide (TPR) repeat protein
MQSLDRVANCVLRLGLAAALLCPGVSLGQAVTRDSAAYARAGRLFWRADTLAQSNDRATRLQALALWREAVPVYDAGRHREELGYTLDRIARVYFALGEPDSALTYWTRAFPIFREVTARASEATALNSIGLVHDEFHRADSALAYYTQALSIRREIKDRAGEATTLRNIGGLQKDLDRPASALGYYAQALPIWRELRDRSREATTLSNIGELYDVLGRLDSALVYWSRALPIFRETEQRDGEMEMLIAIGRVHGAAGRPDSAIAYHRLTLPIWREFGRRVDEAATLRNIGVLQSRLGRPDSAFAYFTEALSIHRDVKDRSGEAATLNNMGAVHISLGRTDSALAYLTRALPIRREVADRSGEAVTLDYLGVAYASRGRPDSAIAFFSRALPIRLEVGDRSGEAATLNNIGAVHAERGQPDSALAYFARALRIRRELRDRSAEAQTLRDIAHLHVESGSPDSALAYYAQALGLTPKDRRSVSETLNDIGSVELRLGRPDSALAYYRRALQVARDAEDRSAESMALNHIGSGQTELGRLDSARTYHARALGIMQEVGNRSGEAKTLNSIGRVEHLLGRADSALVYYRRALPILRELGDRTGEAVALHNIGAAQVWVDHPLDSARAYYVQALLIQREVKDRSAEAASLVNIGSVEAALGRLDSALAYYSRAVAIQREVGAVRSDQSQTLANIGSVLLLSTASGSGRSAAAVLDSAAAMRSQVRRRAGGDANAISVSELGGDTFTVWSRAWQRLARQAQAEGDRPALTRAVASSLAAAERGRAAALRDLLERQGSAPTLRDLLERQRRMNDRGLYASDTLAGADLAAEAGRLLAPLRAVRTALLYYLTDRDTLRAWFLRPTGELVTLPPIAQQKEGLVDRITATRRQLRVDAAAARERRGDAPRPDMDTVPIARGGVVVAGGTRVIDPNAAREALRALSAAVFPAGLDSLLAPGTELVIIPHGVLGQAPFAALALPGDTVPLGARNPLRYAPSLRALEAAEATAAPANRRALVVGNPSMPQVRDESGEFHQLSSLPGAAAEGQWVATRLGTNALTGVAASEVAVRRMLSGAAIVHLATHGLAYGTEARVRDSYVALAPGTGHDGLLTLREILDDETLQLSADLVVLSACQTGLGEAREAEGTVGLQRGLLAKGARSVLVSLWSVDDAATRLLMERFYTHWLDASARPVLSKAEALRRAQSDVRARPQFREPRYWAAFQLVGAR